MVYVDQPLMTNWLLWTIMIFSSITTFENVLFYSNRKCELTPCGDIYCCPYTYCHRRQFMLVLSINIVTSKHILLPGWHFYPAYMVFGDNTCQSVPHILSPHSVKRFDKIIGFIIERKRSGVYHLLNLDMNYLLFYVKNIIFFIKKFFFDCSDDNLTYIKKVA